MSAEWSKRNFEAWSEGMRGECEAFLRQSCATMPAAGKGHWIEDTKEHVRDAGEVFRHKALEKLL